MAPETPEQIITSPAPAVSSCDSDSGCALEEYLDLKPHSSSLKHMLPNTDTEEIKFVQTLLQLLPPQDCDERFCTALGEFERRELQKFSAHRRVHSMRNGAIVHVTADTSDFCMRLIMSERCTIAEGLCWHVEHFCCWECEMVLGGSRYVMKGGRPFCSGCFQRLHAESCEACGEAIDPDGELVMLKGQYWHTLPSCFCCSSCRTPLRRLEFMIHDDHPYCSQHCLSSGPGMHHPSKCHSNMTRASSENYSHHTHCTPWNKTIVGSNSKQIMSSLYETCSVSRCQEVLPRLCLDTGRELSESWLPEHNQIVEGVEDTSCSSSDSEPEGFFLGRPIPNYSLSRGTNSVVHGESNSIKRRHRVKSCKVS
ncbi:prickle-like protein 4 isoform X3 [Bufo gargarizans]|uniref:prickle-like protein 4 isoform X3 n=1 Tax=Bufo gargarizans TaxID=30331 RepID=UPI001CF5CBF4|nr:prickle-like protein 4 isoform X3 [Bufo gargarizans]